MVSSLLFMLSKTKYKLSNNNKIDCRFVRVLLPNSDIPATLSGFTCYNTDKLPSKILSTLFDV
jgi:hypothetical protein